LLDKKIHRQAYRGFSELYRDFRLTEIPPNKLGLWARCRRFFFDRREGFFRLLLTVCVILAAAALFLLISNVIFGSLARFGFGNHLLEVIGTETLK
jgi:ferric-dicitrate binding protein FerR (iron transport regulator)